MPARLHECVITSNDMVNAECEMVQYALYSNTELINVTEALKDSK